MYLYIPKVEFFKIILDKKFHLVFFNYYYRELRYVNYFTNFQTRFSQK